ncbi:MAG TPA: trypsin-like peptidase domain-containing protein [Pyrinomonadaceae bacterium]|nr:trypsin-like peptidase domain-containing protein [Pyrinomonadaceae bacterium]
MKRDLLTIVLISFVLSSWSASAQEQKPPANPPTSGGGAAAVEPSFRLIRSVSGAKLLEQGGRQVIEDPRSVFYVPADKQIIVYFTWEGPAGPHHFEGLWKNPSGRVAMTSEFDYKPEQPRFGAYFKMLLGDAPATGIWGLEARIDGETAGSHSFQITSSPRPDSDAAIPPRRLLNPSEIYGRAAAVSVLIENINLKGARRNVGTGFFIGSGRLLTAFQVIDDATKVRIVDQKGRLIEATEVLSFNRRQDWIVLKVALENMPALERAPTDSWAIGDRSYFLDVPAEGNRVLVETSLIGKQNLGSAGDRLNIGDTVNRRAIGTPLLNEYGEVIGLVGGSLLSGAAFLEDLAFGARSNSLGVASRGTFAVPINLVDESASSATTIEGLARSGQFMPALVSTQSVLSGALASSVNKKAVPPQPIDEKIEFSRANPQGVLLLTWLPREKRKGKPSLRLYDLDNHLISETLNKKKITVTPNKLSYSLWDFNLSGLAAGIYRFDVLLDGDFVWRTFFRMVE